MIRNAWADIEWGSVTPLTSLSHEHIKVEDTGRFESFYAAGYRHFAISNYYPSDPSSSYPLTNLGITPPADALGCPNAEHHSMSNNEGHFCAVGSMFVTGDSESGYGGTWQSFLDGVKANFQYADGGGVTMNHPHGEYPGTLVAKQMLDYDDEIVLGIEVYNSFWRSLEDEAEFWRRWGYDAWHELLVSGRWCLGFGASDRGRGGRNMLLLPDMSAMTTSEKEQTCLRAYREGHFFVATFETTLAFTGFVVDESSVTVETSAAADIRFFHAKPGDRTYTATPFVNGTSATYNLVGDEVYVWAEAYVSEYERIVTQPVLFKSVAEVDAEVRRQRAKRFAALG